MNFVKNVANKIFFLENGRKVEEGKPSDIFQHPQSERLREFLAKIHMLEGPEYVI